MKSTFCPKCRTQLIISDSLEKSQWIKCSNCQLSFENPHYQKPTNSVKEWLSKSSDDAGFKMSNGLKIGIVILFLLWYFGKNTDNSSSNSTKIQNSSYDGSVFQVEKYLDKTLKDPDSYESIEWGKVVYVNDDEYRVRHRYRARNSFGGYVIEDKFFVLDGKGNVINEVDIR